MTSSGLETDQVSVDSRVPLLERLGWLDKVPLAFGFGCLLGLSSPGFDVWWLAWFGMVPLLVLIQAARRKLEAGAIGWAFGFGYYLVALRWLLGLYPLRWMGLSDWLGFQAALLAWLIESLHQSLLFLAFAVFLFALPMRSGMLPHYLRPYFPYLMTVPLLWLFFQWVVGPSEIFLGVPIAVLAYSQSCQLELIQMAKFGGSQLIDFLIVLVNTALAAIFFEMAGLVRKPADRADLFSARVGVMVDLSVAVLIIVCAIAWGHLEVRRVAAMTALAPSSELIAQGPPVPLAILQANVGIEEERLGALSAREIADRYALLGRDLGVALIFMPEAANKMTQGPYFLSRWQAIADAGKKEIVTGSTEQLPPSLVNAVRLITPRRETQNLYIKRRLVPFTEYTPAGMLSAVLPSQLKKLFAGSQPEFAPAKALSLLMCVWGKIGASICVEVNYPRLIAEQVRRGASLLVNVSNLSWFHNSALQRQILAAATMRAVENGRYMVLATNTGISAVIDPSGLVTSESLPGKKGTLVDTVQFLYRKTPFTKMWWL